LEHRIVLDGDTKVDPDGSIAAAINDLVASGNFEDDYFPIWMTEQNFIDGGMQPGDLMIADVNQTTNYSASYTVAGINYQDATTATNTAISSGDDNTFDLLLTLDSTATHTKTGDNGSYSMNDSYGETRHETWHIWGDSASTATFFDIADSATVKSSNVLTLLADPKLVDDRETSANYTFHTNGTSVDGLTTDGSYSLTGSQSDHYGFTDGQNTDGAGSGTDLPLTAQGFTLAYSQDRKQQINESGGPQGLTLLNATSTGSDSYDLVAWAGGSDGIARLTSSVSDYYTQERSLGQGRNGTPDGVTLNTGGMDHANLIVWPTNNPNPPNSQGGGSTDTGVAVGNDHASAADGPSGGGVPTPPVNPPMITDWRDSWSLGWRFLQGKAPTTVAYYSNSQWTQDVANSDAASSARTRAYYELAHGATVGASGTYHYSLKGGYGLVVYMSDIAHLGMFSSGGNLRDPLYYHNYFNLAFLGSFDITWTIVGIDTTNHRALVKYVATNLVTAESMTRIPGFGYMPGFPVKSILQANSMSQVRQYFIWQEVLDSW